jgi:aspartate/methionine/tyrosine aminotransferase
MTHGATGGINVALRLQAKNGYTEVRTTRFGYPFYDGMIEKAGLVRRKNLVEPRPPHSSFALIDSPSNPEGHQTMMGSVYSDVWDSVYHSKIYTDFLGVVPQHAIMVGSYSKLLGITGARIGWIATDDESMYKSMSLDSLYETATLSVFSQKAVIDLYKNLDLDKLLIDGRRSLDDNKTALQKIEYIFDNQPIQTNGMFYSAEADRAAIELLEKNNIIFVRLDDTHIRFNVGQTIDNVNQLVKRIRKADRKS